MSDTSFHLHFIDRERRRIELKMNEVSSLYPLNVLPDNLLDAIANLTEGEETREGQMRLLWYSPANKPTISTFNMDKPFPINSAKKSVRLVLTDKEIDNKLDFLEGKLLSWQGMDYDDTIDDRIQTFNELYLDDSKIDRFMIGAVEMFGDTTYQNILRDPRVTMNFYCPKSAIHESFSYQINAIAEIVQPGDPYFRYMTVMRTLFAREFMSLRSPSYVCAYRFWISEVIDKTLQPKPGFVPEAN